jgi:hypothetical protein
MAADDRWERWSAASGIVFVVLFLVLGFFNAEPPADAGAEALAEFYEERGPSLVMSYFLTGLGAAALVWFAATLRIVLRRAEGEPARLSSVAFAGGVAAAGLLLVAGSAFIAPGTVVVFAEERALDPVLDSVVASLGYIALNFALLLTAVMFTASGLVALRTRVFPAWHAWGGFVVSLALVLNVLYFFGFFVWLAWILVTSIVLLMRSGVPARRARHRRAARKT